MSRVNNTILNFKANFISYLVTFALALVSRKIFLSVLGDEFMGLIGTIQNVVGIVNIAEIGIWPATAYALFEYFHNDEKEKIIDVLSLFKFLYHVVGWVILGLSIILLFVVPFTVHSKTLGNAIVISSFAVYVYSSVISYFINYRQILFYADQKSYVTVIVSGIIQVLKITVQVVIIYIFYKNIYAWLLSEVVFATLNSIYLNKYLKKQYPWIPTKLTFTKDIFNKYKSITKNIKRLVSHKFAAVFITQTDNIFIYSFSGLAQVASFTNYTLLVSKLSLFLVTLTNSGASSLGNLLVSKDNEKIKRVFWELMSMRYYLAGIFLISVYYLIDPFISLWLGDKYLLSNTILFFLLFNTYIGMVRMTVNNYIDAFGLFGHVWAPWTEALINLSLSIILGHFYGIPGVLMGTSVSLILIVCIWQPYYLYSTKFTSDTWKNYWITTGKFTLEMAAVWGVIEMLKKFDFLMDGSTLIRLVIRSGQVLLITSLGYFILLYTTSEGMKNFCSRIFVSFKGFKFKRLNSLN